jgi:hypothetical protein
VSENKSAPRINEKKSTTAVQTSSRPVVVITNENKRAPEENKRTPEENKRAPKESAPTENEDDYSM